MMLIFEYSWWRYDDQFKQKEQIVNLLRFLPLIEFSVGFLATGGGLLDGVADGSELLWQRPLTFGDAVGLGCFTV